MNPALRFVLLLGAFAVLSIIVRQTKRAQFAASDSLFWLFLSAALLLCAIFPQIPYFFSDVLGIQSPSNFVFLAVIALLFVHEFFLHAELIKLRRKLTTLAQRVAIITKENNLK